MTRKQKKVLIRIVISILLTVIAKITGMKYIFAFAYLTIGYDILIKSVKGIMNRQPFDENFLMAVATVGAIALGDFAEGAAVMLFYQIGELFQSYAVGKSRRNISSLMDIRPDCANIECENGEIKDVSPDEVSVGSIIVVNPGEKIPIDGTVISGESSLDTSSLTGESVPRDIREGSEVISGCINLSGVLRIKTTKLAGESTAAKILELVENAASEKSHPESFISKFAAIYTPAVCLGAVLLAVGGTLFSLLSNGDLAWQTWIYRALTFLVISCPCALVISVPLSFFAGIGCASSNGILVKGSNYIELLSEIKYVAFDKTGTVTKGVFEVNAVHHNRIDEEKLLEYAALAEISSNHPIAKSLKKAYKKALDRKRVSNIEEISGKGITAVVDNLRVNIGNGKFMEQLGIEYCECHSIGTIIHVAIDGIYSGHIVISDIVKPESKEAIKELKELGIKKTVMLTGDEKRTAEAVSSQVGVDEVYSELLPANKAEKVKEIMHNCMKKDKLAFAGDGINDAPVLTIANVGIAMGGIGQDAAIEAADVVLMDDNPKKIALAVKLSRKCMRIVYENIYFAIGIKVLCLILGAVGIADMWTAVFADVGVMVIAVLNAMRALRV